MLPKKLSCLLFSDTNVYSLWWCKVLKTLWITEWQASKSSTHNMMWSLTIPFTRRSRVDVTYGGPKFLVPPQILWMSQFSFFFPCRNFSSWRKRTKIEVVLEKRARLDSTFNEILTIFLPVRKLFLEKVFH